MRRDKTALLGSADVFAMACRNRWAGLEQEGFGIVFLEAAAAGVAQVAGDSGGAAEAVVDGETGLVVPTPTTPARWPRPCAACWPTRSRQRWATGRSAGSRHLRLAGLAAKLAGALAEWKADGRTAAVDPGAYGAVRRDREE